MSGCLAINRKSFGATSLAFYVAHRIQLDFNLLSCYNKRTAVRRGATGRPVAVGTSLNKGVIFMSMEYILLLLALCGQSGISSVTVSENSVTIRIKK